MKLSVLAVGVVVAVAAALAAAYFNQRIFIYKPHAEVVQPDVAGVSVEHIRTSDGETLVAWTHPAPKGAPMFLFFDGNGGAPEQWDERWHAIIGGGAGFLAVYYRGYSGSTGHPTEEGLNRDALAGYDWLVAHGYAPHDIVIHGFSLGTGVAIRLATERPARALVLEAPYTRLGDVTRIFVKFSDLFLMDRFPSIDRIKGVHIPVLVAHGDSDSTVPFRMGEAIYAAANPPKEFVRMHGSEHVTQVHDGLYRHVFAFLARHPQG